MSSSELFAKSFVLVAHVVDGFPSECEYLAAFLNSRGARKVVVLNFPLQKRSKSRVSIIVYRDGKLVSERSYWRPNFPPVTQVLDLLVMLFPFRTDVWIGFNPVATFLGTGLARKKTLVNWAIDFVPRRSDNGVAERAYRWIERQVMFKINIQVENSKAALQARSDLTGITPPLQILAPIGVWAESFAKLTPLINRSRRVIYFGSLDERNGAQKLPSLIDELMRRDPSIGFHVIGTGPCENEITDCINRWSSSRDVVFHGYIEDQKDVDELLRASAMAVAPYSSEPGLFTEFADPQKLKYYAANCLPIFMPRVAKTSESLFENGAAFELMNTENEAAWASQILRLLNDPEGWMVASTAAQTWSLQFERTSIYASAIDSICRWTRPNSE